MSTERVEQVGLAQHNQSIPYRLQTTPLELPPQKVRHTSAMENAAEQTKNAFITHKPFVLLRRKVYSYILLVLLAGSVCTVVFFSTRVIQPEQYREVSKH